MTEHPDDRDLLPVAISLPVLDGSFVAERRRSVATVEVEGRAILLEGKTGSIQLLDPVATAVWTLLEEARRVEDLVADLGAMYGADVDVVRGDVIGFVRQLGRDGMLEGVTPDRPDDDGQVDPNSRPGRRAAPHPPEPRFLAEPPSS